MIMFRYVTMTFMTFIFLLGLSGCSRDVGPKVRLYDSNGQVSAVNTSNPKKIKAPVPAKVTESGYHNVKKGETLYAIARDYQVPIRSIIQENNLKAPYALKVRQRLYIPKRQLYKVKPGDTVYGISKNQSVSMNELVRTNQLKSPYQIYVGQELLLPGRLVASSPAVKTTSIDSPAPSTKAATSAPNPSPVTQKYGTNRMTKAGFPRPYPKPKAPGVKLASISKPAARASSKFLWPIKGKLISNYGAKGKGLYNDGLNIAAPKGSPVKAAENGVVAYAGTELKGYGNLILLKHADGYLTAYAHNSANLVKRGEKIKRGQTIAKVGTTGNVDRPQLHFQIRKGKQTVNPAKYLGNG